MERDPDDPAPAIVPFPPASSEPVSPDDFDPWKSPLHGVRTCLGLAEITHDSRETYLSWANAATGPTGNERTIRGINDLREHAIACQNALHDHPPPSEASEAAKMLLAAIEQLLPVTTEAEAYYREERYKQDHMATGHRLHAPLLAAYTAIDNATVRLRVNALPQEIREQKFLKNDLYEPARALLEVSVRPVDSINVDQLEAATERLNAVLQKSEVKSFQRSSVEGLLKAARGLITRLRSPQPFSEREQRELGTRSGHTIHGSPDDIASAYHDVASSFYLLDTCRHYVSQPAATRVR